MQGHYGQKDVDFFAAPLIVDNIPHDMEDKSSTLNETAKQWSSAFLDHAQKTGHDKTQTPLSGKQGSEELAAVWEMLCPASIQQAVPVPSVEAACQTTYLTGFTATMLSSDYEPQAMGCMRIILKATIGCLLVSTRTLEDNL